MSDPAPKIEQPARRDVPASTNESRASWRPARDVLLVVLGAGLALAAEEWRDTRQRAARVAAALAGITAELKENSDRVERARTRHLMLIDTLGGFDKRHALPPPEIYLKGMFNPAPVSSTAWQAARETGALGDMPLATVLALTPAYDSQERYRALAEALNVGIMGDVRRDGIDAVLRDRFTQFIPLATDFSNRESRLLEHYGKALASLDSTRKHVRH